MVKKFDMEQLDDLMGEIGDTLEGTMDAYIIGGFAMMKNDLKASTKDVDIVFFSDAEARTFINAAIAAGFVPDKELPEEYGDLDAITVLKDQQERRFDVFVKRVLKGLVVDQHMVRRGRKLTYARLNLLVGSNEDIFLFKSITSRPADLDDMQALSVMGDIDWNIVLSEARAQPTPWKWIGRLYGRLLDLEQEKDLEIPITRELEHEAEIAAGIELLISHLELKQISFEEAAEVLREQDKGFVEKVLGKMEEYGIVVKSKDEYTLK